MLYNICPFIVVKSERFINENSFFRNKMVKVHALGLESLYQFFKHQTKKLKLRQKGHNFKLGVEDRKEVELAFERFSTSLIDDRKNSYDPKFPILLMPYKGNKYQMPAEYLVGFDSLEQLIDTSKSFIIIKPHSSRYGLGYVINTFSVFSNKQMQDLGIQDCDKDDLSSIIWSKNVKQNTMEYNKGMLNSELIPEVEKLQFPNNFDEKTFYENIQNYINLFNKSLDQLWQTYTGKINKNIFLFLVERDLELKYFKKEAKEAMLGGVPKYLSEDNRLKDIEPLNVSGGQKDKIFSAKTRDLNEDDVIVKVVDLSDKEKEIMRTKFSDADSLEEECENEIYKFEDMQDKIKDLGVYNKNIAESIYARLEGDKFIFVEKYGGENIAKYAKNKNNLLKPSTVGEIVKQICHGLSDEVGAHKVEYYHGDLKLENIVDKRNENKDHVVKIIDWGLSGKFREITKRSMGSLFTTSPERFKEDESYQIGAPSDMWSVGIMTYKLMTSEYPSFIPFTREEISNMTVGGEERKEYENLLAEIFSDMEENPENYKDLYDSLRTEALLLAKGNQYIKEEDKTINLPQEQEEYITELSEITKNCLNLNPEERPKSSEVENRIINLQEKYDQE